MSKTLPGSHDICAAVKDVPSRPKVLVLLATYNGALWLGEQLVSILSQQDVDVHVLVGDDVSKDGTLLLLEDKFAGRVSIELMGWSVSSGSAGANFRRLYLAADVTSFDYVALADQDDIWLGDKLSNAIACLEHSGSVAYSSAVEAFWADGRTKILGQNKTIRAADFLFEGAGQGCTFVIRSAIFVQIQQFCRHHRIDIEALHYHDWLIYILVRAWQLPWYFDAQVGMRYRQHAGNEIGSRGGYFAVQKRVQLIRSGWYRRQVDAAATIYRLAAGNDTKALRLITLLSHQQAIGRSFRLSYLLFRGGRRRLIDRLVLVVSAMCGWL
ncbi:rhamnosyltransferase [Janthinobacterium lividum]|uniref:Rhamnosyltransferase n=1 Tax=Janthinobacterium lividum TaxID=29581 RepID=A0AB38CI79_9BURK|nr:rhamnosyltransferase [Janthinobacterium lividum]